MLRSSPKWKEFVSHILYWETGYKNPTLSQGLSNDPKDTGAAVCIPFPQYHTNKGVTFCTFKSMAQSLGITPVTYERFLRLTSEEVGRFIYAFYQNVKGDKFSDEIGLSLAEAAWGSGAGNAAKHLQRSLNQLGKKVAIDGGIGPETIKAANSVDQKQLYDLFWADRTRFLKSLSNYSTYGKGWMNRVNSFLKGFPPAGIILGLGAILAIVGLAYWYLTTDKDVQKTLKNVELPI